MAKNLAKFGQIDRTQEKSIVERRDGVPEILAYEYLGKSVPGSHRNLVTIVAIKEWRPVRLDAVPPPGGEESVGVDRMPQPRRSALKMNVGEVPADGKDPSVSQGRQSGNTTTDADRLHYRSRRVWQGVVIPSYPEEVAAVDGGREGARGRPHRQ